VKPCSACGEPNHREGQRYCFLCHAAYMREWRKTHPLADEAKRRAKCRAYTRVYIRRGKLKREPCEVCGRKLVQPHHHDYGKPLDVRWLCIPHHRAHHKAQAAA
jgi:hypothetical protein